MRKHFFLFVYIFLFCELITAKTTQKVNIINCDSLYNSHDSLVVLPQYKGGAESFLKLIRKYAKPIPFYYAGMIDAKVRVVIKCNIDKEGNVFESSVVKSSRVLYDKTDEYLKEHDEYWDEKVDHTYCKEEALRILDMIEFIPAQIGDENVCFEGFTTLIHIYCYAWGYD